MRMPEHHTLLGLYVVTVAAAIDTVVIFRGLPGGVDATISSVILTAWNGMAAIVVNWGFGSSSQSARQAELLAAATPSVTPNIAETAANAEAATPAGKKGT